MGSIGAYGPVAFETSASFIRNFEQLREERRARYATHDVLNLEQLLQFLGIDLANIELSMSFHHAFCVPQEELDALRAVLEEHKAHVLVVGGFNLGEFVLEDLNNVWTHVSALGQLLHATVTVRLKEYN